MGGVCARVCPTEVLCEQACVRTAQEDKPVRDRRCCSATPPTRCSSAASQLFSAGAGHRQAHRGRRRRPGRPRLRAPRSRCSATMSRCSRPSRSPAGSTNTASPPTRCRDDFAQREVDCLLSLGGIEVRCRPGARPRHHARRLCAAITTRCSSAWACAGVNALRLEGETMQGVHGRGRLHRAACARRRQTRRLPSAGASS